MSTTGLEPEEQQAAAIMKALSHMYADGVAHGERSEQQRAAEIMRVMISAIDAHDNEGLPESWYTARAHALAYCVIAEAGQR